MAKKKSSPIWLIIFLCAIIVGLVWLINSVKYQNAVSSLTQEIQKLNQEIEETKETKNQEIQELKQTMSSMLATFSAKPSASPSAVSKSKIATVSGERE